MKLVSLLLFPLSLLLLLVSLVAAEERTQFILQPIFKYREMPLCARSCHILRTTEEPCLPPKAPVSRPSIYLACVCNSEFLLSLYRNGDICGGVCTEPDNTAIHHYYTDLCNIPHSHTNYTATTITATHTTTRMVTATEIRTTSTLAISTLVTSTIEFPIFNITTATAPAGITPAGITPAASITACNHGQCLGRPKHQKSNPMKIIIACIIVPIITATMIIIGISVFVTQRMKKKRQAEEDKKRFISIKRYVSKSYRPDDPDNFRARTRFPVKSSLTSATGSRRQTTSEMTQDPYTWQERFRQFKKERGVPDDYVYGHPKAPEEPAPPYPMRLLEETEKLIKGRLARTGKPEASLYHGQWC